MEGDVAECASWEGRRKMSFVEGCPWPESPSTLRGWQWKGGNGREKQNPFKKAEKRVWCLSKQIRSLTQTGYQPHLLTLFLMGFCSSPSLTCSLIFLLFQLTISLLFPFYSSAFHHPSLSLLSSL